MMDEALIFNPVADPGAIRSIANAGNHPNCTGFRSIVSLHDQVMMPQEDCPAQFVRYPSQRALANLSALLQLRPAYVQDWEVELADASRLAEFLDAYDHPNLDEDDRFLLMGIIVASLDDALSQGSDVDGFWARVESILRRHGELHASTMSYWACGDALDPDHQFAITSAMRRVWHDVRRLLGKRILVTVP